MQKKHFDFAIMKREWLSLCTGCFEIFFVSNDLLYCFYRLNKI